MDTSYDTFTEDVLVGGFLIGIILFALILTVIFYILGAIIYYNTAKTNGYNDVAYLSWIPVVNTYMLFLFGSKKGTYEEIKKDALKWTIIYFVLFVLNFIPIINILASIAMIVIGFYFMYRLFYRWTGDSGMSVLFVIFSAITSSLFFLIYGLIKMKKPFVGE